MKKYIIPFSLIILLHLSCMSSNNNSEKKINLYEKEYDDLISSIDNHTIKMNKYPLNLESLNPAFFENKNLTSFGYFIYNPDRRENEVSPNSYYIIAVWQHVSFSITGDECICYSSKSKKWFKAESLNEDILNSDELGSEYKMHYKSDKK